MTPELPLDQRLLVSVKDATVILSRCKWVIYDLIAHGELEAVKAGSSTLIKADSMRRYMEGLAPAKFKPRTKRKRAA